MCGQLELRGQYDSGNVPQTKIVHGDIYQHQNWGTRNGLLLKQMTLHGMARSVQVVESRLTGDESLMCRSTSIHSEKIKLA